MLRLVKLENRIVLDGAAVVEAMDHVSEHEALADSSDQAVLDDAVDAGHVAEAAALLSDADADPEPLNVVLVSDNLPDYEQLADAADPDSEVIVYDADAEAAADVIGRVTAMSEASGRPVASVTVLSHGGSGSFHLGNEVVTSDNVSDNAEAWAGLNAAMADDGKIFLYGCGAAGGDSDGQALLDALAGATGADVYGSDDVTGAGGDWDLEAGSTGADDPSSLVTPLHADDLAAYGGSLQTAPAFLTATGAYHYTAEDNPESVFSVVIFLPTGADPSEYTVTAEAVSPTDPVVNTYSVLDTVLLYNPGPGDVEPPSGYTGYVWYVTYTPETHQHHDAADPNDHSEVTVTITENIDPAVSVSSTHNLVILAQNDAPILHNEGDMFLNPIDEDPNNDSPGDANYNGGTSVADIIDSSTANSGDPITDPDGPNEPEGIAVIGVDDTNGTWQYNTGAGWVDFGNVSEASAVVLDGDAMVRFVPNENWNSYISDPDNPETPGITFKAWDQSDGATPGTTGVNTILPAGMPETIANTTAFSVETETASILVNAVNDPPYVDLNGPDDGLIDNDVNYSATFVEDSGGVNIAAGSAKVLDIDSDNLSSMTVTITNAQAGDVLFIANNATSGTGITADYSAATGVLTLTGVSSEANYQAVLRNIMFNNTSNDPNMTARNIEVYAYDDLSAQSNLAVCTVNIQDANDAPVLNPDYDYRLDDIDEDLVDSGGFDQADYVFTDAQGNHRIGANTVAQIIDMTQHPGAITDPDGAAAIAIAVNGVDETNGTWYYSIDGGTTWQRIDDGALSDSHALLLGRNALIGFEPNEDYNVNIDAEPTFSFRAWDQTSGSAGQYANASINGGTSAFSAAQDTAAVRVAPVNDSPILDADYDHELDPIEIDAASPDGNTVAEIIADGSITEKATAADEQPAGENIAIVGMDNDNGEWHYSTDGGDSWETIGGVSENNALLLNATDMVRFIPNSGFEGEAEFTFKAWDGSNGGVHGTYVDTLPAGGPYMNTDPAVDGYISVSPFSYSTDIAVIQVTGERANYPNVVEPEPSFGPTEFLGIARPEGDSLGGAELGALTFPGSADSAGAPGPSARDRAMAGPEIYPDFCSLEEALQIGCRFANTVEWESRFSSVTWNDLGWSEPPFLDEEHDFYRWLFLRQEGDSGFNLPAGTFTGVYGETADTSYFDSPAMAAARLFTDTGLDEGFNRMDAGELKQAFYEGREHLDKTGRWGPDKQQFDAPDEEESVG